MDWTRLHLALNHLPVVGIPFLVLLLGWGWARSRPEITRLALWWIVWFVPLGIALKFTGDEAAEASASRLRAEQTWVEQHEQAADQAATGLFVLGLAAGGTLFLGRRGRALPGWAVVATLVAGVGTAVLLARTAHQGGRIGHPELRSSVTAAPAARGSNLSGRLPAFLLAGTGVGSSPYESTRGTAGGRWCGNAVVWGAGSSGGVARGTDLWARAEDWGL